MSRERRHYHEDAELFQAALAFTQSKTGFSARFVEKDYYITLILEDLLAAAGPAWAFKGGTCLSKIHTDFYRMSEDLDFTFSVQPDASRLQRSRMIAPLKEHLTKTAKRIACFKTAESLRGFNNSSQYSGRLCYRSLVTGQAESIKVEFSIREPILEPVEHLPAQTLLVDPFRQSAVVPPMRVPTLSYHETYAEKFRAALTRREPAIRDFFDVDHGVRSGRLDPDDRRLVQLIRRKLSVPGNDGIDISERKRATLHRQVQAQLRPVLRDTDSAGFDLDRAFGIVINVAKALP